MVRKDNAGNAYQRILRRVQFGVVELDISLLEQCPGLLHCG